jgi:5-methylcytosine-specific restriction protein A
VELSSHQNTQANTRVKRRIEPERFVDDPAESNAMPLRLKTRCRYPGCPNTARGSFCDVHKGTYTRRSDERRGTPAERGYDATWANVAQIRRQRDACLCQVCLKTETLTSSRIVDHIIPVHVRSDWRLALGNTQVLCAVHHQKKTNEDTQTYGSSTDERLTNQQKENRMQAQHQRDPPRGDDE